MGSTAQFLITLAMQILIGIVGIYYQHRQLHAMSAVAATTHGKPSFRYWPLIAMLCFAIIAWIPVVMGVIITRPTAAISSYGIVAPMTFESTIGTNTLLEYKDKDKILLIVRFHYADIDRMSDTFIEKSTAYTIDGSNLLMSVTGKINPPHLRITPNNPSVAVEYDAVLLPVGFLPEQINSLADVERLGGTVLSTAAQRVPFSSLGIELAPVPNKAK